MVTTGACTHSSRPSDAASARSNRVCTACRQGSTTPSRRPRNSCTPPETKRGRFVQRLFHPGIRQVEPLLNEVRPQHNRQTHRLPSVACLRIVGPHQSLQPRPRNHTLHLLQKQLPPTLPPVLLKHTLTCQTLLLHPVHLATIRLINQVADAELVQRFLSTASEVCVVQFDRLRNCRGSVSHGRSILRVAFSHNADSCGVAFAGSLRSLRPMGAR